MSCPSPTSLLLCGLCAVLLLPGCGKLRFGGTQSQDEVINALRAENHALKKDVAVKNSRIAELEAKVTGPINADALKALPTVATVEIDRLSGVDAARDGTAGKVVVYVKTLDGLGRFVQATGDVDIEIKQEGGPTPSTAVAKQTFSPEQVRAAFRSGFTGTFYVFRLPTSGPINTAAGLIMDVTLRDDVTGKVHTASRRIGEAQSAERPTTTGKQGG
ncbi:MAG TPA: hypothetical protein VHN77_07345 [Phycisphaerales bacterium]|nr:hypothetical protein [Phycisphaerales bacterium]